MDAIHYKVGDEGQVNKRAAYMVVECDVSSSNKRTTMERIFLVKKLLFTYQKQ
jgi:hypothetical protein